MNYRRVELNEDVYDRIRILFRERAIDQARQRALNALLRDVIALESEITHLNRVVLGI